MSRFRRLSTLQIPGQTTGPIVGCAWMNNRVSQTTDCICRPRLIGWFEAVARVLTLWISR